MTLPLDMNRQTRTNLPPPRPRAGYRPTRIGQHFGDLVIIGDDTHMPGWFLARCLCGKVQGVSEKRLALGVIVGIEMLALLLWQCSMKGACQGKTSPLLAIKSYFFDRQPSTYP